MLKEIIHSISPMSSNSLAEVESLVKVVGHRKGEVFIRMDKTDNKEYFVLEGICRSYLLNPEGEEITISFFGKNSILSPFTTRTLKGVSTLNFQALTPVELAEMNAAEFENRMIENLEIREFGNAVLRHELNQKVVKEINMATLTAKQRLMKFRENYPRLENQIPHNYIATYLGITNISLSRLRRDLTR